MKQFSLQIRISVTSTIVTSQHLTQKFVILVAGGTWDGHRDPCGSRRACTNVHGSAHTNSEARLWPRASAYASPLNGGCSGKSLLTCLSAEPYLSRLNVCTEPAWLLSSHLLPPWLMLCTNPTCSIYTLAHRLGHKMTYILLWSRGKGYIKDSWLSEDNFNL